VAKGTRLHNRPLDESCLWDITPCIPAKVSHHEAGSNQSSVCCLLEAGFLLGLPFNHEYEGDMLLRKVG
jgi:hypothetical protein